MDTERKLRVGVIFGGRSGEHEISLMSARFVLSMLDPLRYEVTQIGITHEGAWLTGENVLDVMQKGQIETLQQAAILPDPTFEGINIIEKIEHGLQDKASHQAGRHFPGVARDVWRRWYAARVV